MSRILNILFWAVIAAAFIGPGTVTTAASSGTQFGYALLWALLFSTLACLVLQEASARITVVSGQNLGEAIQHQFQDATLRVLILLLVLGAIILGSAAYEAGNILGGVAGAMLGTGIPRSILTIAIGMIAGLLLYFGSTRVVARFLGFVVALMGITFLMTAILLKPPLDALFRGLLVPSLPSHSGLMVMGLIGTTVVPYNLFLGSGIASGQKLPELRFGLTIAIVLGGIISMGVLIVGAAITGQFSYEGLSQALASKLGSWAKVFFATGLFAAGFSSAITAPLAAAITARSLFGEKTNNKWHEHSWRYRSVWMCVLLVGIGFGLAHVRPITAIILAQALNGVLLPFVAIFLLFVVNDRALMGDKGLNPCWLNVLMVIVVAVTVLLGMTNIVKALSKVSGIAIPDEKLLLIITGVVIVLLSIPIYRAILKRRR